MNTKTDELGELETYCRDVYRKTRNLCKKYRHLEQIRGSLPLYGPPIIEPDIFFISYQGGGGDQEFHETWPNQQLYFNSPYTLGQTLRRIFDEVGEGEKLRKSTGTALIFFQSPSQDIWKTIPKPIRHELQDFSFHHALSFIKRMRLCLVIAIGSDAFNALVERPSKMIQLYRAKIVQEGHFSRSHVLGVTHLTGYRFKADERIVISDHIQNAITSRE